MDRDFCLEPRRPIDTFRAAGDNMGGVIALCRGEVIGRGWGVFIGGWRGEAVKAMGEVWEDGDARGEEIIENKGDVVEWEALDCAL